VRPKEAVVGLRARVGRRRGGSAFLSLSRSNEVRVGEVELGESVESEGGGAYG